MPPTPTAVVDLEGGSADFEDGDWGGESEWSSTPLWEPYADDGECHKNSDFSTENLSQRGRNNIEQIFGKNLEEISASDIRELKRLKFQTDEMFENDNFGIGIPDYWRRYLDSYEGLEYLTCLQWLDLDYMTDGRDHRFVSSLTELKYLNLGSFQDFENVDLLQPLTKLETLILPSRFKSLPNLVQLSNLKRIDARGSASCDIESILEMPELEKLLIGESYNTASDYQTVYQVEESDRVFDISLSPASKYLQLLMPGGSESFNQEPDSLEGQYPEVGWSNNGYMMDLVQSVYELVGDNYDEIVFVGNAEESSVGYAGMAKQISNDIPGLGIPVWSSASCFGSNGKLRGLISLPTKDNLFQEYTYDLDWPSDYDGQLIHESLHLWGGGHLLPRIEQMSGRISGGHWAVTSGDGILGGFNLDTLEIVDDLVYRTAYFDGLGSFGLLPMSPLELYMMGVLPADQLSDTAVFRGVSETNANYSCEDYGYDSFWTCFKAEEKHMVTVEDIIDVFGERPYESENEISILVVAVSENPLTDSEWSLLDEKIAWNAQTSDNGIEANNVWEASGGKVRFVFPPARG